jgi:hypothetical protein
MPILPDAPPERMAPGIPTARPQQVSQQAQQIATALHQSPELAMMVGQMLQALGPSQPAAQAAQLARRQTPQQTTGSPYANTEQQITPIPPGYNREELPYFIPGG